MNNVLFSIPLKAGKLDQYFAFAKETTERAAEYSDLLKRYDIHSAKVWHTHIDGNDFVFVYHDVGPDFEKKMAGWDTSTHPFDVWFRDSIMAVYDINPVATVEPPKKVVDFKA